MDGFLEHLAGSHGNVSMAIDQCEVSRDTVYRYRRARRPGKAVIEKDDQVTAGAELSPRLQEQAVERVVPQVSLSAIPVDQRIGSVERHQGLVVSVDLVVTVVGELLAVAGVVEDRQIAGARRCQELIAERPHDAVAGGLGVA
jgi:hypothetical protein